MLIHEAQPGTDFAEASEHLLASSGHHAELVLSGVAQQKVKVFQILIRVATPMVPYFPDSIAHTLKVLFDCATEELTC